MMELAESVIELHTNYPTRFRGGQQSTDIWMRGRRIGCGLIMREMTGCSRSFVFSMIRPACVAVS
jgi:hypothetical protein